MNPIFGTNPNGCISLVGIKPIRPLTRLRWRMQPAKMVAKNKHHHGIYIYICMNAVNLVQMLDKLDLEQIQEYNPRFVAIGACSQPFSAFEGFCVCLKWNWFKGNLFWSPCAWWSRYAAMFMTFPFAHDYSQSPKIKYPPYRTSNWIDSKLDCCLLGIFIPYSYICIYIYIVYICIYLSIYLSM